MKKSSYSEDSLPLPPPSSSEPPEESEPSPPEEPDTGDRGGNMFVIPVTFAKEHRAMFAHCKELLEYQNGMVAIHPKFNKLIVAPDCS